MYIRPSVHATVIHAAFFDMQSEAACGRCAKDNVFRKNYEIKEAGLNPPPLFLTNIEGNQVK